MKIYKNITKNEKSFFNVRIFIIGNDLNMIKKLVGCKNDCPIIRDNQISTESAPTPVFD